MDRTAARDLKRELLERAARMLTELVGTVTVPLRVSLAVGLAPRVVGDYGVAVRVTDLGDPAGEVAQRLAAEVGPALDVRAVGPVRALGGMPVVPGAQAVGETGRVRPLRPGVSIAHRDVTAGTLGGFVTTAEGDVRVLSNWHVLAGSTEARLGDPVLQPGPADGGALPDDRVGELAAVVPLARGRTATVDAALAALDDPDAIDPTYPAGRLVGWAPVEDDHGVQKTGRTTGTTDGRVSAIELDGLVVGYGTELGALTFDDQIEVESTGAGPFSQGGDSGSLVYRPDERLAVGLLFAGSETGGPRGTGLTYLNPIGAVLEALGVELVTGGG